MGQALYRKYRSKKLSEVVGQEHITRALERALSQKRISHAYLFTGPRGVGKTSIARILAHEVNGLPYDEEAAAHLDIIEIDAASNRRIDEVRDLREKVHIAPTVATYKVYIIDEVHMLTREAFNALLKTLEEPPAHVIFILATTEMHKLPETIISRTQHYAFRPIDLEKVTDHLAHIAEAEGVKADEAALRLIAEHGQGSFRDSISLLDQVRNYTDHITVGDVETMLGVAPAEAVTTLYTAVTSGAASDLVQLLQQLRGQGIAPAIVARQLAAYVRHELLAGKSMLGEVQAIQFLGDLVEVPAATDPGTALELALLRQVFTGTAAVSPVAAPEPLVVTSQPVPKPVVKEASKPAAASPKPAKTEIPPTPIEPPKASTATTAIDSEAWAEVLAIIKQQYNTLYGVLRMAEPQFEDEQITLSFRFAFHQKKINDPKNRKLIADAVKAVCGKSVSVVCVIDEPASGKQPAKASAAEDGALNVISTVFGGGEVLES